MSTEKDNSYGRILKCSALLGGSSLINVALGVLRTKVLAVQLGPALYGTMGLYTSLTAMISSTASLGLGQSAVRDIAAAAASQDQVRIGRTLQVFRRLVWFTGIAGLLATVAMAYPASQWTFGNHEHVWPIAVLSLVILFAQIQAGQTALLQGLRRIRDMTAANVVGAVWSTVMAISILLWLRERGIVAFLTVAALGQLVACWWYARRVAVAPVHVTWRETWRQSADMVGMGLVFVASGLALSASVYLNNATIRHTVGEAGVGLYQSAFAISGVYVGFVLQAMAGDYYPRLAAVGTDVENRNRLVSEQAEMALLLAVPGLVAAVVLSLPLICVLYSTRFAGAEDILRWQVLGLLGRIVSWPMSYILLARGDKVTYLVCEISAALVHVGLVYAGVRWYGLAGAGAGFAGLYVFYSVLIYCFVRRRHGYMPRKSTHWLVLVGTLLVIAAFATSFIGPVFWRFALGLLVLAAATLISLRGLVHRIGPEAIATLKAAVVGRLGLSQK